MTGVEISEGGLIRSSNTGRSEQSWDTYVSYLETESLFLLFLSPSLAIPIPKRAIASEGEVQHLRNLLAQKIGCVFPARRPIAAPSGTP